MSSKIQIILAQGEWSSAKDAGPILKRCNKWQRQKFCDMGNVYVFGIGSICIHEKELLRQFTFFQKKTGKDLTMKQMFDISAKLVSEQDEIYGVNTTNWEDSSWKYLSLVSDEEVISLLHTNVYVFPDSVLCLGKMTENPQSNIAWEDRLAWFKSYTGIQILATDLMVSQWNSSEISSQDSPHCSSAAKSKGYCQDWAYNQKISLDGLSSCRCSTTCHDDLKTTKMNANQVLSSFLFMREDFHKDTGHSSDLDQKRNGILTRDSKPQGEWDGVVEPDDDNIQWKGKLNLPIHESIMQRSAQERRWKIINTLLRLMRGTIETFWHKYFC